MIESEIYKHQTDGETKSDDDVKVTVLSNLQLLQDQESRSLRADLDSKVVTL